jgi:hypothetical protein
LTTNISEEEKEGVVDVGGLTRRVLTQARIKYLISIDSCFKWISFFHEQKVQ